MRITHDTTIAMVRQVDNPPMDGIWRYDAGGTLITRVHTEEGITGYATTNFGPVKKGVYMLQKHIDEELAHELVQQDPFFAMAIRQKLWDAAHYHSVEAFHQQLVRDSK